MQLSIRLNAIAEMVTKGNRLVDVGTDHGYLPIYLVERGQVPSAIAMDINKGPIKRAQEHITEHKLNEYIKTRLSDGVTALNSHEGDTLVIAGMGGPLVIKILTEGKEKIVDFKELILQPQSELEQVRRFLLENEFFIIEEAMVQDDGKYYPMMKVIKKQVTPYNKTIFYKYGKGLLEQKNQILKQFLEKELQTYAKIMEHLSNHPTQKEGKRLKEVAKELGYIKEALGYYEE